MLHANKITFCNLKLMQNTEKQFFAKVVKIFYKTNGTKQ